MCAVVTSRPATSVSSVVKFLMTLRYDPDRSAGKPIGTSQSDARRVQAMDGLHQQWHHAFGQPPATGRLRATAEDFAVDEDLGFAPDGAGEHVLLRVRKRGANTDWAARRIAALAQVSPRDVGYAGLKDRNAVTTQWFSVGLAGRPEPDWGALAAEGLEVLEAARHGRKLRRGGLSGNRFGLVLRGLAGDRDAVAARLEQAAERGVPNYFGQQRFGRDGGNLQLAGALFAGRLRERNRHKRGLYLSAARSFLFNEVLSRRVADGTWDRAVTGEVLVLEGSRSFFRVDAVDAETGDRVARGDCHPSGPLWGRGETPAGGEAAALEAEVLAPYAEARAGLEAAGMKQERRALRLPVAGLEWAFEGTDALRLAFSLPAGAYATSVVRELAVVASERN